MKEPVVSDQEVEPTIPDQMKESMVPAYEEEPAVTCCDQSEYIYICLCVLFEECWLVNILTPRRT